MSLKKTLIIVIALVFVVAIIICGVGFMDSKESVKKAVPISSISHERYIICKWTRVTGYDWKIIQDEPEVEKRPYCIITGADPQSELKLNYEFMTANNKFIFYPTERKEYYSEELKETVVEYVVTGWDILYPVKHGHIRDIVPLSWHIIKSDCN